MKKAVAILLALLVTLVLVAPVMAQEDDPNFIDTSREALIDTITCPDGEATITFAAGSVGGELEQATEAADLFMEACPNVTVEILNMPDSTTERLQIYLQTWEAESDTIDVFQVDVIWPAIIAPHVVDFNEFLTEDEIDMYFEDMINGQTVDGRLVAIPWFSDAAGLYYRTDLLDEYGVDVPTTWEELTEAAATVQEAHRAVTGNEDFWGYVWQGNDYEGLTCDAHEWLVSTTGETFISNEGDVNVDTDAFVDVLDLAASWVGDISPEGVTTYQEEESRNVFQAGNAAFMRNWPYAYNLGNAEDSPIAGMFDWVPLPSGGERSAACLGGWQLTVSQYSDNIPAAVEFAKFLASPANQKVRALSEQGNPPTIPAVYDDPVVSEDPLMSRLGPILGTAYARPSVATGDRYAEASAIFSSGIHDVLTGETTAADGAEQLQAELEEFMAGLMEDME